MAKFDMAAFDCDDVLADMLSELGWRLSLEESMRIFIGRLVPA